VKLAKELVYYMILVKVPDAESDLPHALLGCNGLKIW
jgi:hypothetical protein